jgi:dipeptidyl aminopeptidase/acylaminoacyl peptidase
VRKAVFAVAVVAILLAAAPASAVVSGSNGKILYTLQTPGNFDIWTVKADGSDNAPIVTDAANDQGGAWSPDGTKIAFRSDRTGGGDIYIADANGANQVRMTNDPGQESHPSWSPDGTKIAFTRKDPDDEIFVMDAVPLASAQRLTTNTVTDAGPDWSPDGLRIVFFRGNNVLHLMNAADGSDQREFIPGTFSVGPQWSPDARRVVFQRTVAGESDPHVVNADGTGLANVGQELPAGAQAPSWSPDGTKIVTLAGSGSSDIWVTNPNGTEAVRILDDALVRSGTRWQPVPRAPKADTGGASNIATGSAQLNGTIDSTVLHPTTWFFEYGTTAAYGARTADAPAPSPVGDQAVSAPVVDLLPFTTYHARLVARNANGTTPGPDQTFTTAALPPAATTSRATATQTRATLFGIVDPRGAPAEHRFEFGPTTSYGSTTAPGTTPPGAAAEVSGAATGLKANTTYHYRLLATTPGGTTAGADATVRTPRKAKPRSVSRKASPRRDRKAPFRYVFSGRVGLPSGVQAADGCSGSVAIQVKNGRRTVRSTRANLSRSCAYRKVVSLSARRLRATRGKLKATITFRGNGVLTSRRARTLSVPFG